MVLQMELEYVQTETFRSKFNLEVLRLFVIAKASRKQSSIWSGGTKLEERVEKIFDTASSPHSLGMEYSKRWLDLLQFSLPKEAWQGKKFVQWVSAMWRSIILSEDLKDNELSKSMHKVKELLFLHEPYVDEEVRRLGEILRLSLSKVSPENVPVDFSPLISKVEVLKWLSDFAKWTNPAAKVRIVAWLAADLK